MRPSRTISRMPPEFGTSAGNPDAAASAHAMPKGSKGEAWQKTSQDARTSGTFDVVPRNRTRSATPSESASRSRTAPLAVTTDDQSDVGRVCAGVGKCSNQNVGALVDAHSERTDSDEPRRVDREVERPARESLALGRNRVRSTQLCITTRRDAAIPWVRRFQSPRASLHTTIRSAWRCPTRFASRNFQEFR